jgi:[ribosomal protein S5]-alanine N-acetyltransferase
VPPPRLILETERLVLRELTLDDVDELHVVLGDPVSMRFYPHPFSRDEVVRWIEWARRSYADNGFGLWGLELKESGRLVGDCGLTLQDVEGEQLVEVGYHMARSHQRNGLATEAAAASRDHAFQVVGTDRLIALIRPENVPSRRVAEKIGLGLWRQTERAGMAHLVYAIAREEWLGRHEQVGPEGRGATSPAL